MKRVWRFSSDATRAQLLLFQFHFHGISKPKTIPSFPTALSYHKVNTVVKRGLRPHPLVHLLFTQRGSHQQGHESEERAGSGILGLCSGSQHFGR
ncbi:hypothetical protein E2542_SST12357 [Spatholobus suberectus]|nr:hypothetical protein E2542_SST12357 [Spatholobus suberectus]